MGMKDEIVINKKTEVYLKMLIPIIRNQPGHETFGWDESIDYLIDILNGMRDNES